MPLEFTECNAVLTFPSLPSLPALSATEVSKRSNTCKAPYEGWEVAQDMNAFSGASILAEREDIKTIHFLIISLITIVMRAIKQCSVL